MAISSFRRSGLSRVTSFPFANFSNTATGTYTNNGINYKYVSFTSNGTLTITQTGFADILLVGGGSAYDNTAGYGTSAGKWINGTYELSSGNYNVTIAAGSLGRQDGWVSSANTAFQGPATSLGSLTTLTTGLSLSGSTASITSSITGSSVTYAGFGSVYGSSAGVSTLSTGGIAIVRVRTN